MKTSDIIKQIESIAVQNKGTLAEKILAQTLLDLKDLLPKFKVGDLVTKGNVWPSYYYEPKSKFGIIHTITPKLEVKWIEDRIVHYDPENIRLVTEDEFFDYLKFGTRLKYQNKEWMVYQTYQDQFYLISADPENPKGYKSTPLIKSDIVKCEIIN